MRLLEAAERTAVQSGCSTAIGVARTFGGNDRALAEANGATGNPPKVSDNYRLAGSVNKVCAKMRGGGLKRKGAGLAYRSRAECPKPRHSRSEWRWRRPVRRFASAAVRSGPNPHGAGNEHKSDSGAYAHKARPVLPAGQVRPEAKRRMKSSHINGARTSPPSLTNFGRGRCPPLTGRRLGVSI